MKKNRKGYKQFAKTKNIEAIKIFGSYLKFMFFLFQMLVKPIQLKLYLRLNMFTWASFGNQWDLVFRESA